MRAELITIGDEILIGQIVNTNAVFLAKALHGIGVEVVQISAISDDKNAITTALDQALARADIVLMTGGLGPTNDDITKHTLTDYFEDTLVWYPDILTHIEELFKKYVATPISDLNREQAHLPQNARIFKNEYGTAPAMWFEKDNQVVVSLPGVPYEMKALITSAIIPALQTRFERPFLLQKTIMTYGLGESVIAERIADWESQLPPPMKLAYLPSLGRVRLRLSSKGQNEDEVRTAIDHQISLLRPLIEDIYYGEDEDQPIELLIGQKLATTQKTLALAESCTGGALAARITAHAGVSSFFKGSAVTYATAAKTDFLGVSEQLINTHGVVSAAVAEAMALGAQQHFKSDYALATTGNAGPTAGDPQEEVGVVYIAWATPTAVFSERFVMGNHRERVIQKTVNKAFECLYHALE